MSSEAGGEDGGVTGGDPTAASAEAEEAREKALPSRAIGFCAAEVGTGDKPRCDVPLSEKEPRTGAAAQVEGEAPRVEAWLISAKPSSTASPSLPSSRTTTDDFILALLAFFLLLIAATTSSVPAPALPPASIFLFLLFPLDDDDWPPFPPLPLAKALSMVARLSLALFLGLACLLNRTPLPLPLAAFEAATTAARFLGPRT